MNERDEDHSLVERFQAGQGTAFDLLVRRHQHRLMRMISRLVHDRQEAEDLVQETFMSAYRGMHAFRGDAAFRTWLYRIGINAAKHSLSLQRQRLANEAGVGVLVEAVKPKCDLNTPESVLATKQLAQALHAALAALPLDLRTVLILREIEGLGYSDISDIMVCPIGTVRSRLFRAREAISERLRPLLELRSERRW